MSREMALLFLIFPSRAPLASECPGNLLDRAAFVAFDFSPQVHWIVPPSFCRQTILVIGSLRQRRTLDWVPAAEYRKGLDDLGGIDSFLY